MILWIETVAKFIGLTEGEKAADEEEHSLKENLVNTSDKTESIENSSDLPVVILFGMEDSEVHACQSVFVLSIIFIVVIQTILSKRV